jgi:hypothetical protein
MTAPRMTAGQDLAEFLAPQWKAGGEIRECTIPASSATATSAASDGRIARIRQRKKQRPPGWPRLGRTSLQSTMQKVRGRR